MDILYGLTSCLLIVLSPVDAFQSCSYALWDSFVGQLHGPLSLPVDLSYGQM